MGKNRVSGGRNIIECALLRLKCSIFQLEKEEGIGVILDCRGFYGYGVFIWTYSPRGSDAENQLFKV